MKEFCKRKFVYNDKSEEAILLKSQFKNSRKEGYRDGKSDGYEEGMSAGYKNGMNDGEKNKQLEISKNLLQNTNMSLKSINDCTGLAIEELEKL